MIDAIMAHDISTRANDKSSEKELERIEDAVKQAARNGDYVVFIDHLLYPENEEILQDLGYGIQSAIDIRTNEIYTTIRW
jgi:hypothetical protein